MWKGKAMSPQQPIDLHVDLRAVLAWRPSRLRFDAVEEAHFHQACGPARLRHFVVSGALALIIFNAFLLADVRMIPDVYPMAVKLRLFWFTPMAIILLIWGGRFQRFALSLPPFVLEGMLLLTGIFAAWSMGWLMLHSSSPYAGMYTAGLVPVTIYGNLVQRFRFRYALVFSLAIVSTGICCALVRFLQGTHGNPYAVFDMPLTLLVTVIAIFTLVMNYRFELEERRRFQWSERAQALHQQLAASKAQLDELSRRDALTGLSNRHHFDDYVGQHWPELAESSQPLALLIIDVDHFKAFNDRYGHPAGDQCLKLVAQVLQRQVPASAGCVARWGGEEFIVVLPGADVARAMTVAQGLCEAVSGLGLRHEASTTAASVTISVGVAVARPSRLSDSIDSLVAAADAALYRAKEGGRNRAVAAPCPVSG